MCCSCAACRMRLLLHSSEREQVMSGLRLALVCSDAGDGPEHIVIELELELLGDCLS